MSLAHHRFELHPTPPFRLDLTAWALRRRPNNAVDCFDGARYERVLILAGKPVAVAVSQVGSPDSPRLVVDLIGRGCRETARSEIGAVLTRTLGLDSDLAAFYRMAERDERLGELAMRFRGLRPVRFPSIFEALVNAIACQQLSLVVGIGLLSRLAGRFGSVVPGCPRKRGFPPPEHLARVTPDALRALGFSYAQARSIVNLATLVSSGECALEAMASIDNAELVAQLMRIPGIGRWSAEYVLLRGYGRLDVFPGDDVGARNNLARRFGLRSDADYADVVTLAKRWSPYGGFVYFHLLLDGLERSGMLSPSAGAGPANRDEWGRT